MQYIDKGTFISYLNARLRNAQQGADAKAIAVHYPAEAKSFRFECQLLPQLINCVVDGSELDLSPANAIQLDYYYWHCVLIEYAWKYEYSHGFFHRMAGYIYTYRTELLERLAV